MQEVICLGRLLLLMVSSCSSLELKYLNNRQCKLQVMVLCLIPLVLAFAFKLNGQMRFSKATCLHLRS